MVIYFNTAGIMDAVPADFMCFLFVLFFVLLSQAGLYVYNEWFDHHKSNHSNEVAGIMFGAISLIYSLILAFVIVAAWQDYEDLNNTIKTEADKLNSIMAHSATLPDNLKEPLSLALYKYCNQVMDKEWKMEPSGKPDQPSAIPTLRMMLLKAEPRSKSEESIFAVLDEDLSNISDLRRNRLSHNRSHIPDLVWLVLKSGSIMLVVFSYFFYVPSLRLKRIYLLFLSGCIGMCMFLVYMLDQPFNGHVDVSKQPYANILLELKTYYTISKK